MKKWKRSSAVLAAVLTATVSFTGCGSNGGGSATATTVSSGNGGEAKSDAATSGELAKISFSWWGNDDRHQATQEAIDAFNAAHAGAIEVTGEPSGFGNLEETFATRYAGGTEADIMTVNYPWLIKYSPDGTGFYDLKQVEDIFDFSQYDAGFLETGKTAGVMQAVPYGQNTLGVYLNKSAFDRAGIKEIPSTFEEYKEAAKVITAQNPSSYLIVSPTFRFAAIYYLQQKTGKGEFDENLNMNYTVEDYKEAMTWYPSLKTQNLLTADIWEYLSGQAVSLPMHRHLQIKEMSLS